MHFSTVRFIEIIVENLAQSLTVQNVARASHGVIPGFVYWPTDSWMLVCTVFGEACTAATAQVSLSLSGIRSCVRQAWNQHYIRALIPSLHSWGFSISICTHNLYICRGHFFADHLHVLNFDLGSYDMFAAVLYLFQTIYYLVFRSPKSASCGAYWSMGLLVL